MAFRKPRSAATESLLPGYSGLAEIGGGAFATVYRAVEDGTGRAVALKILKVDTIHAHLIETFHQEIQALAKVSDHPNIVTLYRPATTSDGRPVLVLELCQGSLASRVRTEGPLNPQEVTRAGVKVAGALETAHRNGFLHRDMKPQNILVTNFGEPALADFGVAALQASAQATAGVFGFTTLHAAPEMLEGQHLSPATDVYGLASTMYQLLTGQAPFASFDNEAPASVILRILRDPVRPLRSEHVPLALSDLLEAALSKQPEGRPRTALEFAQALQAVEAAAGWPGTDFLAWGEEGAPVRSAPAPPPVRADPEPAPSPLAGLYPSAPSIRVEGVESLAGRQTLPPLLPAVPPPPAAAMRIPAPPSPGAPVPAPAAPSSLAAPAASATAPPVADPAPTSSPPNAPPVLRAAPPAPPPQRRGPAVSAPGPTERTVVAPEQGPRGQPSRPIPPPSRPLAPLAGPVDSPALATPGDPGELPASGSLLRAPAPPKPAVVEPPPVGEPGPLEPDAAPRPVFVDPDPGGGDYGGDPVRAGESVYEETMAVSRLFTAQPEAEATGDAPSRVPTWAVAGLAVAIAVLVAAGLLLAGIL